MCLLSDSTTAKVNQSNKNSGLGGGGGGGGAVLTTNLDNLTYFSEEIEIMTIVGMWSICTLRVLFQFHSYRKLDNTEQGSVRICSSTLGHVQLH